MTLAGKTIGIIGCGQMGGSMAAALTRRLANTKFIAFDRSKSLTAAALRKGLVAARTDSVPELVAKSEIVILAVPISAIAAILTKHRRSLSEKLLVVDLGSVRGPIQTAVSAAKLTNHVGLHFMCGTNLRGQESWNDSLFTGARCYVFSALHTDSVALSTTVEMTKALRVYPDSIDPRKHDKAFALSSGLPHVIAFSLLNLRKKTGRPNITGPSFESATRVASSDPTMVCEMLHGNRGDILKALSQLEREFGRFRKALSREDARILHRYLENSVQGR